MIENILSFIITIAFCNSEEDSSAIKLPNGESAVPVAIVVAGAKAVQHLPAKERLPGLILVLGCASANAAAISVAGCIKKFDQVGAAPQEPASPRDGGPFVGSPFEKIYNVFSNMENMSHMEQLTYVIELIDAIALFGIFALFIYSAMSLLNNEAVFNFLINIFPFPRYKILFAKFLNYRKISGLWAYFILIAIISLFWDIHLLAYTLLEAIKPNS